ncbi:DUF58 domain-containing protein [bacterium]|nr:DUF58 domain-containing protein [bacterium]
MLEPKFLRKLDNLRITAKKTFHGRMKGERRSPKRGASVEFADYRNYQIGDDFRHVDWNIYARLDKLFLKLFMEEENLNISILLDVSRSMNFGEPSKLQYAKSVAASLGYVGLINFDILSVYAFSNDITDKISSLHGKGQIFQLFNFVDQLEVDGHTDMERSFKKYAVSVAQPGVVIVVSDFLDPQGYEAGLKQLRYHRFETHIIHILSEAEINPDINGELSLEDSETGVVKEITVTDHVMAGYQQRLKSFCETLKNFCLSQGMIYSQVSTNTPIEEFVLKSLRRDGIID